MITTSRRFLIIEVELYRHMPIVFWTGIPHAYRKTKDPYYFAASEADPADMDIGSEVLPGETAAAFVSNSLKL